MSVVTEVGVVVVEKDGDGEHLPEVDMVRKSDGNSKREFVI